MILKTTLLFTLSLLLSSFITAQPTQTVRGKIFDQETHQVLPGAMVVMIDDTTKVKGATSDQNGVFKIENVKIGKHTFKITFIGYKEQIIDITLTSAKEVILNIELEESALALNEVVVIVSKRGEVKNEMALISARTFDVEETEKYAGSRGDPARMVSNFAGVQGSNDSRNDIVVRGNSPLGVVYRIEGFDIPNPNHFAISGSTGGPVSILNNKVLTNSDFFTSAFPAEYGNSTAAVLDLKFRNGNNQKHEFSGQFGFLGTELAAEGPLSNSSGSSYLAVYRYSTLSIFKAMGISLGTDAVPKYQDGAFKLNFPTKNNSAFSIFGIAGSSAIDILISNQKEPSTEFYGDNDRDQYFQTRMGVLGFNYSKSLKEKTLFKAGISSSHQQQASQHNYIIRHIENGLWKVDSIYDLQRYKFSINQITEHISFNTKLNKKNVLKYGINTSFMFYSFTDSVLININNSGIFKRRWDYTGTGILAQGYIQWKYRPSEKITITTGVHSQYFSVSNSISYEPRLGFNYAINSKQSISLGAGIHAQTQPYYTYFYQKYDSASSKFIYHNKNMDFTKSVHTVLGYDYSFTSAMRLKMESYFQYMYNVPVEITPSSFSLLNMGSGFDRIFSDSLKNTGTGTNMGFEITLEKFFNKNFFFLLTGSLYDSKYKGSDNVKRNTDFNSNYAANILIGKEFKTGEKSVLSLGSKISYAGGRWYGYVDTVKSNYEAELIFLNEGYNTRRFKPYFRFDLKINFKINYPKVTHEFALDLVNLLNTKNILGLSYSPNPLDPSDDAIRENYQLGFLPLFYYRLDF